MRKYWAVVLAIFLANCLLIIVSFVVGYKEALEGFYRDSCTDFCEKPGKITKVGSKRFCHCKDKENPGPFKAFPPDMWAPPIDPYVDYE